MLTLDDNESIVRIARKHWFLFFSELLGYIAAALLPPIILTVVVTAAGHFGTISLPVHYLPLFSFAYFIWLLLVWVAAFVSWTMYYLTVWVITDTRVVNIVQKGFFNREVASMRFDRIQDITIDTTGFLATMFNFGDINIESAADDVGFSLHNVSNPEDIKHFITQRHNAAINEFKGGQIIN